MKTLLEAKIEARNMVNAEANRLYPLLQAAFSPLLGQKIIKDGGLMKKFEGLVPISPLQVYRDYSNYTLAFNVRACVHYGDCFAQYDETLVYVGSLEGYVLNSMIEITNPLPTDFTVKKVLAAREFLKIAKAKYAEAEAAVYPFGSID